MRFGGGVYHSCHEDHIRPDWEAKLAAVRAAVTRRANRRIIMRQVGDRLIPVGVGRIQTPEEAAAESTDGGGSRRSRRRQQQQNGNFEQFVGMGNQDLEEVSIPLQRNLPSQLTG